MFCAAESRFAGRLSRRRPLGRFASWFITAWRVTIQREARVARAIPRRASLHPAARAQPILECGGLPPLLTRQHEQKTLQREAPSQTAAPEPTYGNKRNYRRRLALEGFWGGGPLRKSGGSACKSTPHSIVGSGATSTCGSYAIVCGLASARFALSVLPLCHHYALALFASALGAAALFACKIGSGFCAGGLGDDFLPRARARICPILCEALKIPPTGMIPPSL
jgi:hypothetical protein